MALTADQAAAVLKAARNSRLGAYVVICLMIGIRTEEARALRWDHVDLDAGSIAVWRSVRHGGDTKTAYAGLSDCPMRLLRRCVSIVCDRTRRGWPENSRRRRISSSRPL